MPKLFSFSRSQILIILTMAFVLVSGAAYIFIYIPNNKQRIEEQRFRCLQSIESNIKAKKDNSVALLRTLLKTYIDDDMNYSRSVLESYVADYSRENFTLTQPVTKTAGKPQAGKAASVPSEASPETGDSTRLTIKNNEVDIYLYKGPHSIGMKYSMEQFFDSLLPQDTYDQYLVLYNMDIVHQTFESGITQLPADSLPTKTSSFSNEQVKNITLGGTRYKLFTQQLHIETGGVLTIIGLLRNQTYQDEKNALPGNVVIFLLIISILTILALPWIKLYQIGSKDRLTATDGMLTFPIAMLFISVVFFVSFKYDFSFRPGKNASEDTRKFLAAKLERAFTSEVRSASDKLAALDKIFERKEVRSNFAHLTGSEKIPGYGRIDTLFGAWNIERVFWLGSQGQEVASWTASARNAPAGSFANRPYFSNIREGKPIFSEAGRQVYLEPVISWTTGKFVSVVSKESGTGLVAALSFNIKGVTEPVLPAGTSFGIIDRNGKVLYHSNASRNLNENMLTELDNPDELVSSIMAGSDVFFSSKYRGKDYNIYAKAFQRFPFHILVFEERDTMINRDMNVSSFCFFMLFSLFLVMMLKLILVFVISYHGSYFKKHYFDISWIGPDERFHNQYIATILWNLLNIILLVTLYHFVSFPEFLALLMVSVTSIVLFLNCQYQYFYKNTEEDNYILKLRVSWFLFAVIFLITLFACLLLPEVPVRLLVYDGLLLLLLGYGWIYNIKWKAAMLKPSGLLRSCSNSFSVMVFSGLIVTSGIPMAVLFITSYNQEMKLIARYRHKQFSDDMMRQYADLGKLNTVKTDYNKILQLPNVYGDSVWIEKIALVDAAEFAREAPKPTSVNSIDTLYHRLFPYRDNIVPNPGEFYHTYSGGYAYDYHDGVNTTFFRLPDDKYLRLTSAGLRYNASLNLANNWRKGLMYWLLFGLTLFLFWAVLHRILRKLFALDFPSQNHWSNVDEMLLTHPDLNNLLFIIGAPGSGKVTSFRKAITDGKIVKSMAGKKVIPMQQWDVHELDFISIPDSNESEEGKTAWKTLTDELFASDFPLVLFNHFEYDIQNAKTNQIKLDLLEKLLHKKVSRVVVVSTVHPLNFLESISAAAGNTVDSGMQRWRVLLGHFRIVIQKMEVGPVAPGKATNPSQRILLDETKLGHFLVKMQQPILDAFGKKLPAMSSGFEGDSLAAKIGISSHYFYGYVWQSLTKEEKFLLYDLAEDGLVNPYDDYNITILISKGLIVRRNGILKLFNEGFRSFILTAIGNAEAMSIKNQIRDNGNWSKLKTPLIILAVAVLLFLYASQSEAYAEIIKYVGLISLTVPTVYKVFGALESLFERKDLSPAKKET